MSLVLDPSLFRPSQSCLLKKIQSLLLTLSPALPGDCTWSTFFLLELTVIFARSCRTTTFYGCYSLQNVVGKGLLNTIEVYSLSPPSGVWFLPLITWEINIRNIPIKSSDPGSPWFSLTQVTGIHVNRNSRWLMSE